MRAGYKQYTIHMEIYLSLFYLGWIAKTLAKFYVKFIKQTATQ